MYIYIHLDKKHIFPLKEGNKTEERRVSVPNVSLWCPDSVFLEILRHQLELSGRPDVWCDFSSASRCPSSLLFPIERHNHRLNWINRRYIFEAVRLLFSFVAENKVEYQKCHRGDLLSGVTLVKMFMIFSEWDLKKDYRTVISTHMNHIRLKIMTN